MTAASGADWLRKILVALGYSESQTSALGTHSCKATTLSWMSKAGSDVACRRLLGYHVDPSTKTCLVYSRDAASGPLRELERVLSMIRCNEFDPDSTRSGYFRNQGGGPSVAEANADADTESL